VKDRLIGLSEPDLIGDGGHKKDDQYDCDDFHGNFLGKEGCGASDSDQKIWLPGAIRKKKEGRQELQQGGRRGFGSCIFAPRAVSLVVYDLRYRHDAACAA
jgi:hypothetical protein